MRSPARVGLLTTRHHPLLPFLLDTLARLERVVPVLLFDGKDFSAKDAAIFADRTGGAFAVRDLAHFVDRYEVIDVSSHNAPECRACVTRHDFGLLVNAGTPRMVGADLLAAASIGVLNVHPGILPKYRGASCCEWAIYNDDPVGVTAHFMDTGLDSGPIILTRPLTVCRGQSYTDVRIGLYRLWLRTCAETIDVILRDGLTPTKLEPQPPAAMFKPMPDELLGVVKAKLSRGEYRHAV